jgi:hypothetical protein
MTDVRFLLAAAISLAALDPAAAGVFRCSLQQYVTSIYEKDGRWSNRSEGLGKKLELVVTLNEDGTNRAAIQHTQHQYTAAGQWSLLADQTTVAAPDEVAGFMLLSIFKDVDGKRPANYSVHNRFGYGGSAAYSGFCTAQ